LWSSLRDCRRLANPHTRCQRLSDGAAP
jgi:hypothetical protein